jgi:uncharacterized membrane protein YcaP (DUF421 family)
VENSPIWFLSLIAARTLVVFVVLVIGVRLSGKRQLGGMSTTDVVLVLALANAVQNAMTHGSGNIAVGLVSSATLLLAARAVGIVFIRHPPWEARVVGTPTVLAQDGRLLRARMEHEGITEEDVLTGLRKYGLTDLRQVRLVVLEPDGSLSVVPYAHDS